MLCPTRLCHGVHNFCPILHLGKLRPGGEVVCPTANNWRSLGSDPGRQTSQPGLLGPQSELLCYRCITSWGAVGPLRGLPPGTPCSAAS